MAAGAAGFGAQRLPSFSATMGANALGAAALLLSRSPAGAAQSSQWRPARGSPLIHSRGSSTASSPVGAGGGSLLSSASASSFGAADTSRAARASAGDVFPSAEGAAADTSAAAETAVAPADAAGASHAPHRPQPARGLDASAVQQAERHGPRPSPTGRGLAGEGGEGSTPRRRSRLNDPAEAAL
jgi:hypothetical protein